MARPPVMEKPMRLDMRLPEALVYRLDRWRGTQSDVPSRSEAIRRVLEIGLRADASHAGA